MKSPFVLSHHPPSQLHRCVQVGGVHLCARCLGVYPVMLAAIGVQIVLKAGLAWPADPWIAFLLPVPALVDWARGKLDPATGSNASRLGTGALLGLSLGRTIFLHLRRPGFALTMAQLAALAAVFLGVELLARLRKRATDRKPPPDVPTSNRSGQGP